MLKEIFNSNNQFWIFINKLVDVLVLSVMWLGLCLPIVTCGAASTAAYYTMIKNVRCDRGKLFHEFFHSFKDNFKQSTGLTVVGLAYVFVSWILVSFAGKLQTGTNIDSLYPLVSGSILMIPFLVILPWVFPLLSRFEMKNRDLIKASFYFGIRNIGLTIVLVAMLISFCVIAYCMPFWIIILPGVYTWLSTYFIEKGIMRYMKKYRSCESEWADHWMAE